MRLHWSEPQSVLRRRFADLGAELAAARACRTRAGDFDHAAWRALAEAGLWALPVPRELGGAGESFWELAAGLEGLATTIDDLGLLLASVAHAGYIRVIVDHGTEEQRRALLPRLMSGAERMLEGQASAAGDPVMDRVAVSDGLGVLHDVIALERALYGLIAAAFAEPVLRRSLRFANQRCAFKKRVSEHSCVQLRLTDIKIAIETSRSVAYLALDSLLRGAPEASLLCSLAKLVGTEQLSLVAQHDIALHGHRGYMDGEISRLLCDAQGARMAGGASDIQRVHIFDQLQKLWEQEG